MRYNIYRYNSETCHYERVRVNLKTILWYGLGACLTAACMLVGILILHDFIVNTDTEKRLIKENRVLKQHHTILLAQLNELQPALTSLENRDKILHKMIFGSPEILPEASSVTTKEKLLLADAFSFRTLLSAIRITAHQLISNSSNTNKNFGNDVMMAKDQFQVISSLPTLLPFQSWHVGSLISGFGLRVNPFHKGLYEHIGIDLAMPRGTPVIATASGVIVNIKRSDLQAGYGNYIEIDHGQGLVTRYAHLQDIHAEFGDKIDKGVVVGTVGTSGGSIAPHLHYEILRDGKNVDPIRYMIGGLTSDEHYHLVTMSHQQNQSLD